MWAFQNFHVLRHLWFWIQEPCTEASTNAARALYFQLIPFISVNRHSIDAAKASHMLALIIYTRYGDGLYEYSNSPWLMVLLGEQPNSIQKNHIVLKLLRNLWWSLTAPSLFHITLHLNHYNDYYFKSFGTEDGILSNW